MNGNSLRRALIAGLLYSPLPLYQAYQALQRGDLSGAVIHLVVGEGLFIPLWYWLHSRFSSQR